MISGKAAGEMWLNKSKQPAPGCLKNTLLGIFFSVIRCLIILHLKISCQMIVSIVFVQSLRICFVSVIYTKDKLFLIQLQTK